MTFCGVTNTSTLKEGVRAEFANCKTGNDMGDGPFPTK
jgi:hypothetical protein